MKKSVNGMILLTVLVLISVIISTSSPMPILVKTPDGKTMTLDVEPSDTALELKYKIAEQNGGTILPDQQRLIFRGRELLDGRALHDFNVQTDSTVQLLRRLHPEGDY